MRIPFLTKQRYLIIHLTTHSKWETSARTKTGALRKTSWPNNECSVVKVKY